MQVKIIDFTELPVHDTTWALNAGLDGNAYVGACCEHRGGVAAVVLRYAQDGTREALVDMGEATGQPADNGRATQCKVHDALIVDDDGLLYAATHLSGPPIGHLIYNPWGNWGDPHVSFVGATLVVYDTHTDQIVRTELLFPQEGCRCLALDKQRKKLYSCTYPLNHFHVWDLQDAKDTDYGRIGAVNSQAIWVDPEGNGYTCNDVGRIVRFDAKKEVLEELDIFTPHPAFQNGWHNVSYDVVACPDESKVIGVCWNAYPHLWMYDMGAGLSGKMLDLGPVHENLSGYEYPEINNVHVGGLSFGPDGKLYVCAMSQWEKGIGAITHIHRFDIDSGEREDLGALYDEQMNQYVWYVSRAVWISRRDLIGALVGRTPTGIVHIRFEEDELTDNPDIPFPMTRLWG